MQNKYTPKPEETAVVKKPSKRDRILAKRAQRSAMLDVNTSMEVTLECPQCKIQHPMTLDEYFTKIGYGGFITKPLNCETCGSELMFFKTDMKKVAAAGFTWERTRKGISKEEMQNNLDAVDNCTDQMIEISEGIVDKANLKATEVKNAVKNIFKTDEPKKQLSEKNN